MTYRAIRWSLGCVTMLTAMLAPATTHAQIGPTILWEPWAETPHWADTVDEVLFFNTGSTKGPGGARTDSWYWNSYGRIKPDRPSAQPALVIGYRVLTSTIKSDFAPINGDLWDIGVVAGGQVAELANDWRLSVVAGAGTANDGHFSNTDAIYGMATVDFTRPIDDASAWHLGLTYDGNALLWPDVPLPYAACSRRVNEQLSGTLGLPVSSARYQPWAAVALELRYAFPVALETIATVELTKHIFLFAQYNRDQTGFAIDGANNRRLFHELNRVSGGVRCVTRWVDVSVGVGYAFDQRHRAGFDIRDTRHVATVSEEMFFSVKLQGTF